MSKQPYTLKLSGSGLSFDRTIDEATATSIINLIMTGAVGPSSGSGTGTVHNTAVGLGAAASSPFTGVAGGNLNPKQFMAQKKPSTEYQRLACLGYYLLHMRGTPQFKTADLVALNTEAAQRTLSNASRAVNDSTGKYSYFSSAGGGKKQMTNLGEAIVEALPDQEKVKAATAENRPRTRRSTKKKKAKKS